ncbi:MAG: DUF3192 domain-containing protein [Lentisphaerae bacterium]|nr:DUF3192 domain-containing protein [Lentisphaerota bacterium]
MKRLWFAWIALLFITAGCASLNPYKVAEKNIRNSKQLRIGMTKAEVLAVMGEPEKNESFSKPDVWFYYYDCNWLDGFVTEEECFPLVFADGKLLGFGNNFYAKWQLENRDRMPNVELPPEAFAGDKKQ